MSERLGGLLLAGGGSTRFGSDKALAVVDGRTLLERGVACLRAACDGPVLAASGDGVSRPGVADGQVADLVEGAGPLSAIGAGLAALEHAGCDGAAVLAVDHLAPSSALLCLLDERRNGAACALVEVDGRLQPLQAVWSVGVASEVSTAVARGERSVLRFLAASDDVVVLHEEDLRTAGIGPDVVRDADTPSDLPGAG